MRTTGTARAAALLLVAAPLACEGRVKRDELPGVYVLHPAVSADTLWLERGGQYRRVFVTREGGRATASGPWEVDKRGARWALSLGTPDSVSAGARMPPLPPLIRPLRRNGALRLPVDETTGAVYEQIARR